ncbi:type 1 fimbrial protein [Lelliottia amnigena]|uniref:Type 1 fimbrial protein n=1 Tax=Lelliottia amnigena TaxID=61646 RepID=A0AAP2F1K6_LELAM|nr:fimbrial protein [Lelliottia amnigena]MBL5898804.1 type 1 fimbrial protein [Lelliottia amnigena]MBL5934455.1 type 1 fimbrial protein [Lelliottia amnigena]
MKRYLTLSSTLLMLVLANTAHAADDNVHFSGALVSEPCTLPEADQDIHLDFGTVIEQYLYQYQRTKSQSFTIHLTECDPTILNTVSVTFQGAADTELTNMLALDESSISKGVAIGLELADGTPLAINKSSPYTQLTTGNNSLTFNAFAQAKPSVVTRKSLTEGEFTATASFMLTYQ